MATAVVEERQLLKAMTWWDGFVVALANPGFLIAALGASIGALGTTGAFVLWTISVCLGALQNNIYAEMATMFPNKSGGIALYAHEAWRKYFSFVGPVATFGYWFAWSSVLAINGYVVGTLVQAEWFSDTRSPRRRRLRQSAWPIYSASSAILRSGSSTSTASGRRCGSATSPGPAAHPRLRPDVPAIPHRRLVERQHEWNIGSGGGLASPDLAVLHGLVGLRLRGGGGVRARVPLSGDRHPRALRASAASRWWSMPCCRSGSAGPWARRRSRTTRRPSRSTRRPSTCSSGNALGK